MKKLASFSLLAASSLLAANVQSPTQPTQYISSVQLTIQEPHPDLIRRAQKLIVEHFSQAVALTPVLQSRQFETVTNGNDVLFTLNSPNDVRVPVREALTEMIDHLNGRVLAKGRSHFYKAALNQPMMGGYLEVVLDDSHRKIVSIAAQSVPLRDLLKEIRNQAGAFSYLIPGDCADQLVDWSFGESVEGAKDIDVVMEELATLFGLNFEIKNGTFIFKGGCQDRPRMAHRAPTLESELLRNTFFNAQHPSQSPQVFFPVSSQH